MNKSIITVVVVFLIVGGGAFYGGMKYTGGASSQGKFSGSEQLGATVGGMFRGGGGMRRGGMGGGFVRGEIISKDDKSVTVKLQDGGSKIVFLSGGTQITTAAQGSVTDLQVGAQVLVSGTANQDGSVTARSIQLSSKEQ